MHFQELIENRKEELVSRLQECIRIPSVYREDESGYPYGAEVHRCLQYMLEVAGAMGFETHNMDNQVGWCEYGNGEEMVAVLGHLDVVPEGDGWSVPPFEGLVKDGKIYGRGTMDDKGPTVAALFGLLAIKETGLPVNRRIRLIFGLNEETGSADMKYYAAHGGEIPVMGFTPDGEYPVINGEKGLVNETYRCEFTQERFRNTAKGTTEKSVQSNVLLLKELWGGTAHNIVPNHAYAEFVCESELAQEVLQKQTDKCVCTATADGIRIEAEGIGAHGGTPWEGENAIGRLMQFLAELPLGEELKKAVCFLAEKLGMEYDGAGLGIAMEDAVSGILTMNLGTIRGGEDYLEVKLNYRYPVTKSFADCGPQVCEAFQEAGFEQIMSGHKACLYMPPESELVQKLMKVYTDCTGEMAEPKSIGGGTYAKMLPNVLAFGPIFPGDEVREHKPDEFMEISRLIDNANILAEAMYSLACE